MANLKVLNGDGDAKYLKESGAGSDGDPHIVSVAVDSIVSGTGATNLGKAEDGAHTSGDVGVMALSVRQNTPAALGGTDADYQPLITGPTGRLWTSGAGGESITATLTVTNGAYSIADVVGGLITLAGATRLNGGHSIINSIKLSGVSAIPYQLWFFSQDIATPAADNAAFALAAADGLIFLGSVIIAAGDYLAAQTAFNNACLKGVGLQVKSGAATTSIYAYLVATAVTSPGTTTLYLTVDLEYID